VVSSSIILDEDVTTSLVIGLVLVIVGVAVNLSSDRAVAVEQPTEVV
jgi:hypothetical protein